MCTAKLTGNPFFTRFLKAIAQLAYSTEYSRAGPDDLIGIDQKKIFIPNCRDMGPGAPGSQTIIAGFIRSAEIARDDDLRRSVEDRLQRHDRSQ